MQTATRRQLEHRRQVLLAAVSRWKARQRRAASDEEADLARRRLRQLRAMVREMSKRLGEL